jgi:carboxyl-terminal processing protease
MLKSYLSFVLCCLVANHAVAIESSYSWPKSNDLGLTYASPIEIAQVKNAPSSLPQASFFAESEAEVSSTKPATAKKSSPTPVSVEQLPVLEQEKQHNISSRRLSSRLSRMHYKPFERNKAFSQSVFHRYFKLLDYNHLFFTQADLKEFTSLQDNFFEMYDSGRLQPAYNIFNRLNLRRFERYQYALKQLEQELTFSVPNESLLLDRSQLPWAKDKKELDEIWYLRVKSDALNLKLTGKKWPEIKSLLTKRYSNNLKRLLQVNSEDAFQLIMNAYARSIGPHTTYLSPRNADQFQERMSRSLEGIGAVLRLKDDYTYIQELVPGGPADKSNKLESGDRIIAVGQKKGSLVDVIGWRIEDIVDLIKGPKGSQVHLQVLRSKDGANAKPIMVDIIRDKIYLEDLAVQASIKTSKLSGKSTVKVGVLTIPSFYYKLSQDTLGKLREFEKEKVGAVVVDLRGNTGGLLSEATLLTSLFTGVGPAVQIRETSGKITVNSGQDSAIYMGPLVVMVDRYSASASEIFAAAIQDYGRGLIVGDRTFGKGTVQQHSELSRSFDSGIYDKPIGSLQYTMAKFYRINGESTQLKGVTPDIAFPTWLEPTEFGEAEEDNPLEWDTIPKQSYRKFSFVVPKTIEHMKQKYQKNIKTDPEFSILLSTVADYKSRKNEKQLSLVEMTRKAKQKEADSLTLQRMNQYLMIQGKKTVKSLDLLPENLELPDVLLNHAVALSLDLREVMSQVGEEPIKGDRL